MEDLIIKYFEGKLSEEEKRSLLEKVEKEKEVRALFISYKNLYALTESLPGNNDRHFASAHFSSLTPKRHHLSIRMISGIAAAAAIIIGVLIYGIFFEKWGASDIPASGNMIASASGNELELRTTLLQDEFSTSAGEVKEITLKDGSVIWLNANTIIKINKSFNTENRCVELISGEAFFDVAHNKDIPFIVTSKGYSIKVLGTKFNVTAYSQSPFKTSLLEGSIELSNCSGERKVIKVVPNETIEELGGKLVTTSQIDREDMMWKKGVMSFKNTSFSDAAGRLERCYGVSIEIRGEELASYPFSGKIRIDGGIEAAMSALQKIFKFNYSYDREINKYTVTP